MPRFCPRKIFFILTLHTLRQLLYWPLISISTSQPMHKPYSGPLKKKISISIYKKTANRRNSRNALLVAKKVPYNFQMTLHENFDPSCRKQIAPELEQLFDTSKNLKKLTLNGPRNGQSERYSKIQTKVSRAP